MYRHMRSAAKASRGSAGGDSTREPRTSNTSHGYTTAGFLRECELIMDAGGGCGSLFPSYEILSNFPRFSSRGLSVEQGKSESN